MKNITSVLLLTVLLGACAAPKTADEFQATAMRGTMGHSHDSFATNRSVQDIGRIFQARSNECLLNKTVTRTTTMARRYGGQQSHTYFAYNPTVFATADRAELHVQVKISGDVLKLQEEQEAGMFILVAKATPVNRNSSNVEVSYAHHHATVIYEAVKKWVTEGARGCPDLASPGA